MGEVSAGRLPVNGPNVKRVCQTILKSNHGLQNYKRFQMLPCFSPDLLPDCSINNLPKKSKTQMGSP